MEVVNEVSGKYKSGVIFRDESGIEVVTRFSKGEAYATIGQMNIDRYIAACRGVDMPHDRAQHYHDLLVSKAQAFIGEIEAVMKEIGL